MLIKTIASGSGGNCYVVEHNEQQLLIECGISLKKIRQALNFNLSRVIGCLVSHEHNDHCKAVPEIAKMTSIPIRGPETIKAKKWSPRYESIRPGVYFSFGDFIIKAFEVEHDVDCFAYMIAFKGNLIFYITDTCVIPYVKPNMITHLIIETNHSFRLLKESDINPVLAQRIWETHLDIEMAALFAKHQRKSLREVYLIHLSDEHSNEKEFKNRMEEATGVPVYVAPRGII